MRLEHKVRVATRGIDLTQDTHRANQALEDILAHDRQGPAAADGATAETRLREQQMLARLARQFSVAEAESAHAAERLAAAGASGGRGAGTAGGRGGRAGRREVRDFDPREVELLEILLRPSRSWWPRRSSEIEAGQLKSEPVPARSIDDLATVCTTPAARRTSATC